MPENLITTWSELEKSDLADEFNKLIIAAGFLNLDGLDTHELGTFYDSVERFLRDTHIFSTAEEKSAMDTIVSLWPDIMLRIDPTGLYRPGTIDAFTHFQGLVSA